MHRAHKEVKDHLECQVRVVVRDYRGHKVRRETLEQQDSQVPLVHRDKLDLEVIPDLLVSQVLRELVDQRVAPVQLVPLAAQVLPAPLELLVILVLLDRLVSKVSVEILERLELLAVQVQLGPLDSQDKQDSKDLRVMLGLKV